MAATPAIPVPGPAELINYSLAATNAASLAVNTSRTSYPEVGYRLAQAIPIGIVLCLIIFFSIAGNVLVCVAIFTDRTLRKVGH